MTRAYSREAIKPLTLVSDSKDIHLEILSKMIANGMKIGEIPGTVTWDEKRVKKNRKSSTFKYKKFMASHFLLALNQKLSATLSAIGLLIFSVGFILGLYIFFL